MCYNIVKQVFRVFLLSLLLLISLLLQTKKPRYETASVFSCLKKY